MSSFAIELNMGKPYESWGRKATGAKDRAGLLPASCHGTTPV